MNDRKDSNMKNGFGALDTLGRIEPGKETYFTYECADGSRAEQLIRYPEVSYRTRFLLEEDLPGILHSSYDVDNFFFCDRLEEFAVVDPGKKALFVDVGLYDYCGTECLDEALATTDTSWQDAEVLITHLHDDHDGNVRYCLDKGARKIYVGRYLKFDDSMTERFLRETGVERAGEKDLSFFVTRLLKRDGQFIGYEDRICVVQEGDRIDVGDYHFEVLETPGHSPEHICLVEKEKKILFAGDHILEIAPGHMTYFSDLHLLRRFLATFENLKKIGIERVFMCHHDPLEGVENINAFMDEIVKSYERPVNKTLSLLDADESLSVYEVAQRYYARLESWDDQPIILMSRRIAVVFTYLEYLVDLGRAVRTEASDGALEYRRVDESEDADFAH